MRWLTFFIFAYCMLGVQTGIDAFVRIEASGSVMAELNLVLIAVVFVCVYAPRRDALLASLLLGAMQDLVTQQSFGLFAFGYGALALLITGLVQAVHRGHPLTHFSFALLGGGLMTFVVLIHHWLGRDVSDVARAGGTRIAPSAKIYFGSMIYTAILSPIVINVLQRFRRVFGFQSPRMKMGTR